MKIFTQTLFASVFAATVTFGSALDDIPTTAVNAGAFNTLVAALGAADLVTTLSGPGPFTVFAPTDDAFAALPDGTVNCLLRPENKQALTDVLLYHVASGNVTSSALNDGDKIMSLLAGAELDVDLSDGVKINQSTVTAPDVFATNGVIHIIDQVLVPSSLDVCLAPADIPTTAISAGVFDTLVAALSAADLVTTLSGPGPFTVFAPTDDAFAALPDGTVDCLLKAENTQALTDVLLYHVASGNVAASELTDGDKIMPLLAGAELDVDLSDGVKINQSTVTTANVFATNGLIHIIDQVLVPPSLDVCLDLFDIPTTAIKAGAFNTLVAALGAADLVTTLSGPGPFTVFAPTDDAFAALPDGTVDCLLKAENKQSLTDVLLYHVASGNVAASELTDGDKIMSLLAGAELDVDLSDGVKINQSTVTTANVFNTNGIIHIIDQVLLPPSLDLAVCEKDEDHDHEDHDHDDHDDEDHDEESGSEKISFRLMYSVVTAAVTLLFTAV